jgi:hypothetical protein
MSDKVDLMALDAEFQEETEINTEADAFGYPPPPPDGTYAAVLSLDSERGITKGKTRTGDAFLMAAVRGKLVVPDNPEIDGREVFDNVTTLIMRSGTSRTVGILKAGGQEVPSRMTIRDQMIMLQELLQSEPTVMITGRWEGSYESGVNAVTGKKEYTTAFKGMKSFPQDADGNPQHKFVDSQGHEINTQFSVTKYEALG